MWARLVELMPNLDFEPALAAEFNRRMARQYESIRDFIILHYKLTQRDDSDFWRYCAGMPIPDSLMHQIELFRTSGRVAILDPDSFLDSSWVSIYLGHGLLPQAHEPGVDLLEEPALRQHFSRLNTAIAGMVRDMPSHGDFVAQVLRAMEREPAPA